MDRIRLVPIETLTRATPLEVPLHPKRRRMRRRARSDAELVEEDVVCLDGATPAPPPTVVSPPSPALASSDAGLVDDDVVCLDGEIQALPPAVVSPPSPALARSDAGLVEEDVVYLDDEIPALPPAVVSPPAPALGRSDVEVVVVHSEDDLPPPPASTTASVSPPSPALEMCDMEVAEEYVICFESDPSAPPASVSSASPELESFDTAQLVVLYIESEPPAQLATSVNPPSPTLERPDVEVMVVRLEDDPPAPQASSSPPGSLPSPAIIPECESSIVTPSSSRVKRTKPRSRKSPKKNALNYGSDASDSDDDNEEKDLAPPVLLPRAYRQALDSSLDPEPELDLSAESSGSSKLSGPSEGPMQPGGLFDFVWSPFPDPPIPARERREPFSQTNVGPTVPNTDPYSVFTEIWDESIMGHIVKETNRYAQDLTSKRIQNNSLGPKSRLTEWKDTCIDELYTFFALIMAMGVVGKSSLYEYWSIDDQIFSTPGFRSHMNFRCFQLLCTCLHFNNNMNMNRQNLSPAEARLFKIQPIISHLNNKFQAMYTMEQNISLDESLMQWKGWLSINQFIPNKVAKVGIKTYEVCESQSGYLWRFVVHAPKKHLTRDQQSPLDAVTPSLVLELLRGLEGRGHTVWMDNYYNSPALARRLKSIGFDAVGTLRINRRHVPSQLSELTRTIQPGQITGLTSGDVDIMIWYDVSRVATISTYHGNTTSASGGRIKPNVVIDYNIMMGGVDKKDQLLAAYPVERKKTRVWYKKFFRRLLNVSVLNSYIIAKKSSSVKITHRSFRIKLVNALLSRHSAFSGASGLPPKPDHYFEAKKHFISEYPMGKGKSRLRRRCCECKKSSHYYCAGCEKTVCLNNCFASLHS